MESRPIIIIIIIIIINPGRNDPDCPNRKEKVKANCIEMV
jgi:hypothetical protein